MSNWPIEADPLTLAIQHLNSSPYALTKDECIDVLRKLRNGQSSQPTAMEVGEVVYRDRSSGHPVASFNFDIKGYAVKPGDKLYTRPPAMTPDEMRGLLSKQGLAIVPMRMTTAMQLVSDTDGWDWPEMLSAACAITEAEYARLKEA